MIELTEYLDDRGTSQFAIWRADLDPTARARIDRVTLRLGEGNLSATKGIGSGVLEMRLDFGPGYRVYLAREGDTYILLLGGGTKRWPQNDIGTAKARWLDYKRRKRNR